MAKDTLTCSKRLRAAVVNLIDKDSRQSFVSLLDAHESRPLNGGPSFSFGNRTYRALWNVTWLLLASWTPAFMHPWRRLLLRLFGASIAGGAHVYPSAKIWFPSRLEMGAYACLGPRVNCYCMAKITIGSKAIVSQDAELCAGSHDLSDRELQLIAKPIVIGHGAWIAAGALVGPGVTIGRRAVLGARAVTFKDIPESSVYVGNPAVFLRLR